MKAILISALSVASLSVLTTGAIAQTCYDDGYNIVDLGSMCREHRATPSPASQAQSSTSAGRSSMFPAWLVNGDQQQARPHRTAHERNYSRWIFEERYVMSAAAWPYTVRATDRYEWMFLDCQTLNHAKRSLPFIGSSEYWERSINESFDPEGTRQAYSNTCQRLGL